MEKLIGKPLGLVVLSLLFCGTLFHSASKAGEFNNAWHSKNTSIVLDAYEYTPIDWTKIKFNKRLAGFINKASDGLSPKASCGRNALCRVKWRRYAATKELYHTRRILAKTLGMKWGAYHLARPGNPIGQAEHFLNFARPDKDDLIALDIEHNDPKKWMSLSDAEIFARHIKMRTGRYPVLYTNHSTSKFIAAHKKRYKLLSRLNLWYARYKPSINGVFPMGNWDSYTLWQFSSMINCSDRSCPWRINGAGNWIDVNVVNMSPEKLRKNWPFAKLQSTIKPAEQDKNADVLVVASQNHQQDPGVDKTVTGSVPLTLDVKKSVSRASLKIVLPTHTHVLPTNMWIAADKVIVPTWKEGAKVVFRAPYRTSDQIVQALKSF